MEHIESAGIITYTLENETVLYLLLHYTAGHWDLPKGKMETGETKEETASRELLEETGLTAQLDEHFLESFNYVFLNYDKQIAQKTVYFFLGRALQTNIQLSNEHIDYAWLPYKEALEKLTYDNAKGVLKKAHKSINKQENE